MGQYDRRIYWIWLAQVLGTGSHRVNALCERFPHAQEIYEMNGQARRESRAFTEKELLRLETSSIAKAEAVFLRAQELGCHVLTPEDAAYPKRLRNIYAMPAVLYVKGDLSRIDEELVVSVVGTRSCTEYGRRAAQMLSKQLAEKGAAVISGLAAGIDTAAIEGALSAGGRAYAVIGCGMDIVYPAQNKKLMEWMCEHTAVLTEYPPATPPYPGNFPQRNRLISGLGLGTVVVEAGAGSGALITAGHALEQGKDVFGVTARMDDRRSYGVFELIRAGAKPVFEAEDILEEYRHLLPENGESFKKTAAEDTPESQEGTEKKEAPEKLPESIRVPEGLDETEEKIFSALGAEPVNVQMIAARTGLGAGELLPALTEMEIEGIVSSEPMGCFRLTAEYRQKEDC